MSKKYIEIMNNISPVYHLILISLVKSERDLSFITFHILIKLLSLVIKNKYRNQNAKVTRILYK